MLGFLQDVAARDWEAACLHFAPDTGRALGDEAAVLAESRRIEREFVAYHEARGRFRLDPEGRAAKHTHFEEHGRVWQIAQILADTDGQDDWEARFTVSLDVSHKENRAVVEFVEVKPVGDFNPLLPE